MAEIELKAWNRKCAAEVIEELAAAEQHLSDARKRLRALIAVNPGDDGVPKSPEIDEAAPVPAGVAQ